MIFQTVAGNHTLLGLDERVRQSEEVICFDKLVFGVSIVLNHSNHDYCELDILDLCLHKYI